MTTIQPLAAFHAASASQGSGSSDGSAATTASQTQDMFLQLLVAQLQNQDPLNPMDGTQFVSQLAQFSELEQMIGVNQGVQQLVVDAQGTGSSGSTGSNPGTSGSTGSTTIP